MKRIILSFAILLIAAFTVSSVSAQVGLRAGLGFSNIKYIDGGFETTPETKLGVSLGLSKEINVIGQFLKIVPELQFDIRGQGDWNYNYLGQEMSKSTTYNYVGLGVGAKVNIPVLPLYVLGQPYFQYLVSGQEITQINENTTTEDIDNLDDINRSEFGLNLGLGAQFALGPLGMFAEARYAIPMTKLADAHDAENYSMRNKYFTVSLGLLFGGK